MRKTLIIIIILLIVLIFGQVIYYNFNKTNNVSSLNELDEEIEDTDLAKNMLYIKGMSRLYDNYNPKISFDDLENRFYILVNEVIPTIYDNVENKKLDNNIFENLSVEEMRFVMNNIIDDEEIMWLNEFVRYNDSTDPYRYINYTFDYDYSKEQYYDQNIEQIKKMNIFSKEDFVMIAYQINNTADKNKAAKLYEYNVETDTISKSEDGLISFKVNLGYDNEKNIQIL